MRFYLFQDNLTHFSPKFLIFNKKTTTFWPQKMGKNLKAILLPLGLANFDEACSKTRSQAVATDKGFMTSVILGHELGHV